MGTKTLGVDLDDYRGGTSTWWRHPIYKDYTYTDGIKAVAEDAGAYWIIEKIFSSQFLQKLKEHPFQVWDFVVEDEKGRFTVSDGNHNVITKYTIEWTDFPPCGITFWFTDNVLLLPVEY